MEKFKKIKTESGRSLLKNQVDNDSVILWFSLVLISKGLFNLVPFINENRFSLSRKAGLTKFLSLEIYGMYKVNWVYKEFTPICLVMLYQGWSDVIKNCLTETNYVRLQF